MLTFTTLTLIATLLHRDRFHLRSADLLARPPPGSGSASTRRSRRSWRSRSPTNSAPPARTRRASRPSRPGSRLLLGAQGAALLLLGAALFLAPQRAAPLWPWSLTALTARAIGAWLAGLGVAAAQATWENDWTRVRVVMFSEALFGLLQVVALVRYPDVVAWGGTGTWLYLALLIGTLAIGL